MYRVANQAWAPRGTISFHNAATRLPGISLVAALHRNSRDILNPNDRVFDDISRVKVTFHVKVRHYARIDGRDSH